MNQIRFAHFKWKRLVDQSKCRKEGIWPTTMVRTGVKLMTRKGTRWRLEGWRDWRLFGNWAVHWIRQQRILYKRGHPSYSMTEWLVLTAWWMNHPRVGNWDQQRLVWNCQCQNRDVESLLRE
jgi:hypothetical protein